MDIDRFHEAAEAAGLLDMDDIFDAVEFTTWFAIASQDEDGSYFVTKFDKVAGDFAGKPLVEGLTQEQAEDVLYLLKLAD